MPWVGSWTLRHIWQCPSAQQARDSAWNDRPRHMGNLPKTHVRAFRITQSERTMEAITLTLSCVSRTTSAPSLPARGPWLMAVFARLIWSQENGVDALTNNKSMFSMCQKLIPDSRSVSDPKSVVMVQPHIWRRKLTTDVGSISDPKSVSHFLTPNMGPLYDPVNETKFGISRCPRICCRKLTPNPSSMSVPRCGVGE